MNLRSLLFRSMHTFVDQHTPWVVALLAAVLYSTTLSQHYSGDSLIHAMVIDSGDWKTLLHPRHPLLYPIGWFFYQGWRILGWNSGSLVPLQILDALSGALCVGLLYAIIHKLTQSLPLAIIITAGFTISGGMWLLSTDAEFVTISLAIQLSGLKFILTVSPDWAKQTGHLWWLAFAIALATYIYLTNLFLFPLALVGLMMQWQSDWGSRCKNALVFTGAFLTVLIPVGVFLWIAVYERDLAGIGASVYGQLSWLNVPKGIYALLRSLAWYPLPDLYVRTTVFFAGASAAQRLVFGAYYIIVAIGASLPMLATWIWRRQMEQRYRRPLALLGIWTLLYGSFALYWVPADLSFWAPVLVAWWLLVALVVSMIDLAPATEFTHGLGQVIRQYRFTIVIGGVSLLLVANTVSLILPRHDLATNQPYQMALAVAAHTASNDLVIVRDDDVTALYVLYFAQRSTSVVSWLNDSQARQTIAEIRDTGGRVFAIGITPAQVQGTAVEKEFARFRQVDDWQPVPITVLELLP